MNADRHFYQIGSPRSMGGSYHGTVAVGYFHSLLQVIFELCWSSSSFLKRCCLCSGIRDRHTRHRSNNLSGLSLRSVSECNGPHRGPLGLIADCRGCAVLVQGLCGWVCQHEGDRVGDRGGDLLGNGGEGRTMEVDGVHASWSDVSLVTKDGVG